jgi:hypothetical protein
MNLKDMIAKMDAIEAPSKKQKLEESASMNISMTADDAGQVGQLMSMMRNAGMSPEKVSDRPLAPRMDMEKHMKALGAMDDPSIPGKDDVPGDMDLKAGAVSSGLGNIAGQAIGGGPIGGAIGSLAGGGGIPGVAGGALGTMAGNAILPGVGGMIGGALGSAVGGAMNDDEQKESDYANSPEEEYSPHTDVIKGGNDLNKSKKSYPKVAGGDNPMALASKIKEELSTLYKEYTGEAIVKEGGVKSMMQDVEEGMGKAEFEKKYPGADYAEIKQDIKDNAEENN